ncbi:exosome complex component RRP46-like [Saccostrea cucullata]|uniref:exosome complex component RRP46-like n=1 Tax=Saccostrea cuccullata TaxID=36930 RepID=UPI002ED37303
MAYEVNKLRELSCTLGDLSRPDGDSTFSLGDTCVTTAVYGPGEVKMTKELLDKATIEVVYKPKSGLPGCAEKLLERTIRNSCETVILGNLHPRSMISITVQEIQNRGSLFACCINSTCMALLDAGVSMRYLMAAVTCAINDKGDTVMDPDTLQEQSAVAVLTFVFENCDYGIVTVNAKGSYTLDQFQQCLSKCKEASKSVFQFFKDSLCKKLSKND